MACFWLDGQYYQTQKSVRESVLSIKNTRPLEEPLKGHDHRFVDDLLSYHPEEREKRGIGVKDIVIRITRIPGYRQTKGFWIRRLDGTEIDFSYEQCLKRVRRSFVDELRSACRYESVPELLAAKKRCFEEVNGGTDRVLCELSGRRIRWDECELDHVLPHSFEVIFQSWRTHMHVIGVTLNESCLTPCNGTPGQKGFVDDKLRLDWLGFHRDYVNRQGSLRLVHRKSHRRLPNQRYKRPKNPVFINGS